ncbi:MAG: DUF1592 domain-containing protein [Polyangiaceae bacterium]|nr:DUF1592 domain-containing protein [Polyangiaceae bacterium]
MRDLFPGLTLPVVNLPQEAVVGGFLNNARGQAPSPTLIEQLQENASAIAALAVASPTKVLPCTVAAPTDEVPCGHKFIETFGKRAFRRPLAPEERDRLEANFDASRASYGFPVALRMAIETMLQAPQFLYLVEVGEIEPDGRYRLGPYEIASRISYFIWNTMPDDALIADAEAKKLDTAAGVDAAARRLLADPRAHEAVATFQEQWLRLGKIDSLSRNTTSFPWWNDGSSADLLSSTRTYVDYLFWERGKLGDYFTDSNGFVNDNLAKLFGAAAPGGTKQTRVPLDPTQRSGIITYPGLMAAFAHSLDDSPVQRGVFVLDRFLCAPPDPPPPNVNQSPPAQGPTPKTTRDRFAQTHEQGSCANCHKYIDGVGFGFEHYDATGAWRTTDSGQPVNASGELTRTDVDGPFNGATELAKKLATSRQVQTCVARQWLRYSLGLDTIEINDAMTKPVAQAFVDRGLDVRELVVAVATSDAFRYRVRTQ